MLFARGPEDPNDSRGNNVWSAKKRRDLLFCFTTVTVSDKVIRIIETAMTPIYNGEFLDQFIISTTEAAEEV